MGTSPPPRPSLLAVTGTQRDLPLLVFLPGMDGSALTLQYQSDTLKNKFDARCFVIPGEDRTGWSGLVSQLLKLVAIAKAEQPHRPIYLCGESFGGCLALQAICAAPHLFDRLVLVNPASSFKRQVWSSGAFILQWLPRTVYRLGAVGLLPFLIASERVSKQNNQALLDVMRQVAPETAAWRLSLLRSFQLDTTALTRFRQPTLLITSTADRLLPSVAEGKQLKPWFKDSRILTLPNSGHACLLETDVSFYQLLRQGQFVAETTAA